MQIRFGLPGERRQLEELQRRASLALEDYRAQLLANPDAIVLPEAHLRGRHVRVAQVDDVPGGFSVILPADSGIAELDGLFVEPALWRRGIGRALVADARILAQARGAQFVAVTADPRAEAFYMRCGFAFTGPADTRFGPASRMRCTTDLGTL